MMSWGNEKGGAGLGVAAGVLLGVGDNCPSSGEGLEAGARIWLDVGVTVSVVSSSNGVSVDRDVTREGSFL
jgi:hypothetical protein